MALPLVVPFFCLRRRAADVAIHGLVSLINDFPELNGIFSLNGCISISFIFTVFLARLNNIFYDYKSSAS